MVAPNDVPLRRRLLEMPSEEEAPDPETVRHKTNLFLELLRCAESGSCRHDAIQRYLGDEEETLAGCGGCDVCQRRSEGVPAYVVASDQTLRDVARLVPRALAQLEQAHGIGPAKATRYGAELLAALRDL